METSQIQIGTIALARRQTGVCDIGEIGVCYEIYMIEDRPGYSFIFQSGRHDGFSPKEVSAFLMVTDDICPTIADYQFIHVMRLRHDFDTGRFDEAFSTRPRHR